MPAWTLLAWTWFVVRVLSLIPLAFITFAWLFNAVHGVFTLGLHAEFAWFFIMGGLFGTWLGHWTRQAWRALRGTAAVPEGVMRAELLLVGICCALCLLGLAIAWPSFRDLVRKSAEGANKGNLAVLRQGVMDYQSAHDGRPPSGLDELDAVRALPEFPHLWSHKTGTNHLRTTKWNLVTSTAPTDSGQFAYFIGISSTGAPEPFLYIDCTHTDSKGTVWTSY